MSRYVTYICDPGAPRDLTPEQMVEKCKCRHARYHHWWGGGPCGECGGRLDGRGCDYFRPRKTSAARPLTPVDDASAGHGLGAPRERMTP